MTTSPAFATPLFYQNAGINTGPEGCVEVDLRNFFEISKEKNLEKYFPPNTTAYVPSACAF